MGIEKNVTGQKLAVFAWDYVNNCAKTGDAANITAQRSLDFGAAAATNDVNPSEMDATNLPGWYAFDLTQAETNANVMVCSPVSSTEGVVLDPVQVFTVAPNHNALAVDGSGRVDVGKWAGTAVTLSASTAKPEIDVASVSNDATAADNLERLAVDASGRVDVGKWAGTAVTLSATTAKPEVDVASVSNDATAADNLERLAVDASGRVDVGKWAGTAVTLSASTAKPEVDVASVSNDATAADNLEAVLDGGGAVLTLSQLRINSSQAGGAIDVDNSAGPGMRVTSASGDSVIVESTGGNGDALTLTHHGTGQQINSAAVEMIADTLLQRDCSYVEADMKAASNFDCLGYLPLAHRRFSLSANPGYVTVYQTDGVTELCQIEVTTAPSASPVSAVGA